MGFSLLWIGSEGGGRGERAALEELKELTSAYTTIQISRSYLTARIINYKELLATFSVTPW